MTEEEKIEMYKSLCNGEKWERKCDGNRSCSSCEVDLSCMDSAWAPFNLGDKFENDGWEYRKVENDWLKKNSRECLTYVKKWLGVPCKSTRELAYEPIEEFASDLCKEILNKAATIEEYNHTKKAMESLGVKL